MLRGHTDAVRGVAFSRDGALLASCSDDKTARLWSVATAAPLRVLEGHTNWVWSVAFSPDGATIATGGCDKTARLWATATGAAVRVLEGHANYVTSVAFSPDGATLATGSRDKSVRLWWTASGALSRALEGHKRAVTHLAFARDGATLASGSEDNAVNLWSAPAGELLKARPLICPGTGSPTPQGGCARAPFYCARLEISIAFARSLAGLGSILGMCGPSLPPPPLARCRITPPSHAGGGGIGRCKLRARVRLAVGRCSCRPPAAHTEARLPCCRARVLVGHDGAFGGRGAGRGAQRQRRRAAAGNGARARKRGGGGK